MRWTRPGQVLGQPCHGGPGQAGPTGLDLAKPDPQDCSRTVSPAACPHNPHAFSACCYRFEPSVLESLWAWPMLRQFCLRARGLILTRATPGICVALRKPEHLGSGARPSLIFAAWVPPASRSSRGAILEVLVFLSFPYCLDGLAGTPEQSKNTVPVPCKASGNEQPKPTDQVRE